jgi:hypothetical protein
MVRGKGASRAAGKENAPFAGCGEALVTARHNAISRPVRRGRKRNDFIYLQRLQRVAPGIGSALSISARVIIS